MAAGLGALGNDNVRSGLLGFASLSYRLHLADQGFITWSLAKNPQILDRTLAHGPAAIMLSFGDPRPFAAAINAAGALLICQVQTVA